MTEPERIHFPWQANYRPDRRDYMELQKMRWKEARRSRAESVAAKSADKQKAPVPGLWFLAGIMGLLVLGLLIIRIMLG